jgi:hypothetical protein
MSEVETTNGGRKSPMTVTITYVFVSVLVGSVGQVLLKKGMGNIGPLTLTTNQLASLLWRIGTNPYVILGLAIYGGGTVFLVSGPFPRGIELCVSLCQFELRGHAHSLLAAIQ